MDIEYGEYIMELNTVNILWILNTVNILWILNTVNITVNIEHGKLLTVKYGYYI